MTIGDGLACIGTALLFAAVVWAVAWSSVRHATIRAEALRQLGEPTWQTKKTTTRRPA